MYVNNINNIEAVNVNAEGAENVKKQVLIGPEQGWEGWIMRSFYLEKNGHTPRHQHPWPHINYILSGKGILYLDGEEYNVEPGSVAYVPDNKVHQFKNNGDEVFSFICIIPEKGS